MSAATQALAYSEWTPIFSCVSSGPRRKNPLTKRGLYDATRDPATIERCWRRWPNALIGMPTGPASGRNVLDIDAKDPARNGFDTLARLGWTNLPLGPLVHTPTGGAHVHFDALREIRNTGGALGRGIGAGLDWRGSGGYVILPSPGSGYRWDENYGPDYPLGPIPPSLLPRAATPPPAEAKPAKPETGLSYYAEAALDSACRVILAAPNGEQDVTLVRECFNIGTLAGARGVPEGFARRALVWAAMQLPSYDANRPWRPKEIED